MDFSFSEEQDAVRELARKIFSDRCSHERSRELERSGEWYDRELWGELARANLPGLALPESHGGSGFGILEACVVLEEAGRALAPVPLLEALILGAMPIAAFGSEAQQRRWLPAVASGEAVPTAALVETGSGDPAQPRTRAAREGDGWRLEGEKVCVPAASLADALLVPARTESGCAVFLLEAGAPGLAIEPQQTTRREPQGRLALDGVRAPADALLGDPAGGRAIVEWILDRARLGLAALELGVADEALRRTAAYAAERKQFGRPIGAFQGPQLRAADAYIDVEAMRAVLWQAAWRVSEDLPAATEIATARWWSERGADRVVHTAQHLHGGIGADVDYPIHRYFLWAQQLGVTLGSASEQLARLGAMLASEELPEA